MLCKRRQLSQVDDVLLAPRSQYQTQHSLIQHLGTPHSNALIHAHRNRRMGELLRHCIGQAQHQGWCSKPACHTHMCTHIQLSRASLRAASNSSCYWQKTAGPRSMPPVRNQHSAKATHASAAAHASADVSSIFLFSFLFFSFLFSSFPHI